MGQRSKLMDRIFGFLLLRQHKAEKVCAHDNG